jgi:hypothetical protein
MISVMAIAFLYVINRCVLYRKTATIANRLRIAGPKAALALSSGLGSVSLSFPAAHYLPLAAND